MLKDRHKSRVYNQQQINSLRNRISKGA